MPHVQTVENDLTAGATTITQAITYSAGNLAVVCVACEHATATVTVTDGVHTYTEQTGNGLPLLNAAPWQMRVFVAHDLTAGARTVTVTFSTSVTFRSVCVMERSGLATSSAVQFVAAQRQTTGTTRNAGTQSNTADGDLVGFGQDYNQVAGPTAGASFTGRTQSWQYGGTFSMLPEDQAIVGNGSRSATWGMNNGADSYCSMIMLSVPSSGQVFTEILTDDINVNEEVLAWMLRNKLGDSGLEIQDSIISAITGEGIINTATLTDAILASDGALVFILRNRQLDDGLVVSEGDGVQRYFFISADSEVVVTDEVLYFRRIFRLLEDGAEIVDQVIASIAGAGSTFTSTMTSAISVTDANLAWVERNRMQDDSITVPDVLDGWVERNRLGDDSIEIGDDGARYALYFRFTDDLIEITDELIVSYQPYVDTYVTQPVLLGVMPNPVVLGARQSVVLH